MIYLLHYYIITLLTFSYTENIIEFTMNARNKQYL